jgi:hypothetical protein
MVVKGQAEPALLDSYEQERIPVAEALLNGTDRGFRLVVSNTWFAGLFRTQILARAAAIVVNSNAVQRRAFRLISQTGIRYPKSFLSKSLDGLPESAPQAGDRFPWLQLKFAANGPVEDLFQRIGDTRFNLVLIGQPPLAEDGTGLGDLLRTHVIPSDPANDVELARAQVPNPSFYLIRPDGYIGLCGRRFAADYAREYTSQSLHLGSMVRASRAALS